MDDAPATLVALGFDAVDPPLLARFWAGVLRWQVGETYSDGSVEVLPTDGALLRLVLRPTTDSTRPAEYPLHLDITTTSWEDQRQSVETVLQLSGSHLDIGQGDDEQHVVMADPEGNALCLIEPTNNFLRECGRVGAVSCDGSRTEGFFWRDALGWPLTWDQGEETAITVPSGTPFMITWGGPSPEPRPVNRLHLEVAGEPTQLVSLGATLVELDGHSDFAVMTDPDGYRFRVVDR